MYCVFVHLAFISNLQIKWKTCLKLINIHDFLSCVKGCDASVLLSAPNGDDEHNAGADVTLSADALDLVNKIKAAIDSNSQCTNKVSCADILAMAARDVVSLVSTPTSF
jgi:Peroxidase